MYALLSENDLLKNEVNYWPQLGLLLFSCMLSAAILMFIQQSSGTHFKYNNAQLLMLVIIFMITIVVMHVTAVIQTNERPFIGFLAPVAVGAMLIALLLDTTLAFVCSILIGLLSSIILNTHQGQLFDFELGFFAIVVSFVAIFATHRASQRSTILKGAIMVCLLDHWLYLHWL